MAEVKVIYQCLSSEAELNEADLELFHQAVSAIQGAHAPYSQFQVGAAVRLTNGSIVQGSNQENASFPLGLCAERVAIAAAVSQFPHVPATTIAVSYHTDKGSNNHPITPCGMCRQVMVEYERAWKTKLRLILAGQSGPVWVIDSAHDLLPLGFSASDLESTH